MDATPSPARGEVERPLDALDSLIAGKCDCGSKADCTCKTYETSAATKITSPTASHHHIEPPRTPRTARRPQIIASSSTSPRG